MSIHTFSTYKSSGVLIHEDRGFFDDFGQSVEDIIRYEVVWEALAKVQWLVLQSQLDELDPDVLLQPLVLVSQVKLTHLA